MESSGGQPQGAAGDMPSGLCITGNRGLCRVSGGRSLPQTIEWVAAVLGCARERGVREMLLDGSALTDYQAPNIAERFFMAEKWSLAAGPAMRVALVVPAHLIDPNKFGVTVARNRGMRADVFTSVADALAWLDGGH